MPMPFGPQLIGETEKTLGELLRRFLEGPASTNLNGSLCGWPNGSTAASTPMG
jgi:hypothetical protein